MQEVGWSSGFKNPYAFYFMQLSGETVSENVFKEAWPQDTGW